MKAEQVGSVSGAQDCALKSPTKRTKTRLMPSSHLAVGTVCSMVCCCFLSCVSVARIMTLTVESLISFQIPHCASLGRRLLCLSNAKNKEFRKE